MVGCTSRLVSEVVRQDRRDIQLAEAVQAASLLQEASHRQPGLRHQGLGMSCVKRGGGERWSPSRHTTPLPSNPGIILSKGTSMDQN